MQKIISILSVTLFIALYYALWLITLPYFVLRFAITTLQHDDEPELFQEENPREIIAAG